MINRYEVAIVAALLAGVAFFLLAFAGGSGRAVKPMVSKGFVALVAILGVASISLFILTLVVPSEVVQAVLGETMPEEDRKPSIVDPTVRKGRLLKKHSSVASRRRGNHWLLARTWS
jgi:hypothetical protein